MHKQILLVSADISNNALGRAWILAEMLAAHADVRIIGLTRAGVWPPLAQEAFPPVEKVAGGVFGVFRLWRQVWRSEADVIYVCKPKFPNLVAALLARRGRVVVLDNDDWEAGCARGGFAVNSLINWLAGRGISFTQLADFLIPLVKRRTVSNVFLQKRYGGVVIPHARDAKRFEKLGDSAALRQKFGLPVGARIVMFFGTPHKHKGVDELLAAMTLAQDKTLFAVVAGLSPDMREYAAYKQQADALLPGRYAFLPYVDWRDAPALLACADVLVVPQRDTLFTRWGQTPAKVFDAMAAGKPLVVSDIADTAAIVGDGAWLTPPDDAAAIAAALDAIMLDPTEAAKRAARLKARFLALYSYEAVAPKLVESVLP
ncbi:MAG: glycosyltransferase family 4 protein [Rickettsiales bacterium]|nr:glycosyltransferase family 4 protein [Rickettsiales bacterium]